MAVHRVNDDSQFIWLSTDEPPIRGKDTFGAKGYTLDTGQHWIYDGNGWVEDLTFIYLLQNKDKF